jgi:hypothetical protein
MQIIVIAFTLIILGLILQLKDVLDNKREINRFFLLSYSLGVFFLIIDSFKTNNINIAVFNIITLILAMVIFILLSKK